MPRDGGPEQEGQGLSAGRIGQEPFFQERSGSLRETHSERDYGCGHEVQRNGLHGWWNGQSDAVDGKSQAHHGDGAEAQRLFHGDPETALCCGFPGRRQVLRLRPQETAGPQGEDLRHRRSFRLQSPLSAGFGAHQDLPRPCRPGMGRRRPEAFQPDEGEYVVPHQAQPSGRGRRTNPRMRPVAHAAECRHIGRRYPGRGLQRVPVGLSPHVCGGSSSGAVPVQGAGWRRSCVVPGVFRVRRFPL